MLNQIMCSFCKLLTEKKELKYKNQKVFGCIYHHFTKTKYFYEYYISGFYKK